MEYAAPAPEAAAALPSLSRARAQRAVLDYLLARGRIPLDELKAAFPHGRTALRALERRGLVRLDAETPVARSGVLLRRRCTPPRLTPAQAEAVEALAGALGTFQPFLLHGVTGSGKTEVYLQVIARARERGRGALVLVPEIALTPAALGPVPGPLRRRRGPDALGALRRASATPSGCGCGGARRASAWASGAPSSPRSRTWRCWWWTRSTTAASSRRTGRRYHARDLAVVRAKLEDAVAGAGLGHAVARDARPRAPAAATAPSRSRRASTTAPCRRWSWWTSRAWSGTAWASCSGLVSPQLSAALDETLAAGQQAILFLNRRGYQTLVVCEACGQEARCTECAVSLTHHARRGVLLCHYCGRTEPAASRCPACGGVRFGVGVGTEQVEEAVRGLFPRARVGRLDRDAVSSADDTAAVLARFANRELDVLVGTQMVTKGHDFPGVTLVGVILADTALALPDFRAAERTFQLLAQVAGRAGRGADAGRVLIQTFNPRTPAVACATTHDYAGFAEGELERRRVLSYPPFGRMMAVRIEGSEGGARRCAEALARAARPALGADVAMLGPAPAALERLRGLHRWHILFRADGPRSLFRVHGALAPAALRPPGGASVRFDMDPYSMM